MLIRTAWLLIAVFMFAAGGRADSADGGRIAGFRLPDSLGKEHALADLADHELVVVAFLGTECPLAKLYAGDCRRLRTNTASGASPSWP